MKRQKLLLLIWEILFHILCGYLVSGPTAFCRVSLQTPLRPLQAASTWLKASSSQLLHRCLSIAIASNFFKLLTLSAAHVINPEVVAQVRLQNLCLQTQLRTGEQAESNLCSLVAVRRKADNLCLKQIAGLAGPVWARQKGFLQLQIIPRLTYFPFCH